MFIIATGHYKRWIEESNYKHSSLTNRRGYSSPIKYSYCHLYMSVVVQAAAPLVWLDIVKNEIYRRAKKLIQLEIGLFHLFFPLHPISLCSKVLIPSSNLWRASPTSFRASKKVKNWQNITFSWTGECTHTQLLCLYGDNLMCSSYVNITIQM